MQTSYYPAIDTDAGFKAAAAFLRIIGYYILFAIYER